MNLYNDKGEWSDELLADAAAKGVAPNQHPEVLKLPIQPPPPGQDIPWKLRPEYLAKKAADEAAAKAAADAAAAQADPATREAE
jgi:hypothetical protein